MPAATATLHRYFPDGQDAKVEWVTLTMARQLIGRQLFDNRKATKAEAQTFARTVIGNQLAQHPSGYSYLVDLDGGAKLVFASHMAEHGDDRDLAEAWAAQDDQSRRAYRRAATERAKAQVRR